jgi:hypothetical protein
MEVEQMTEQMSKSMLAIMKECEAKIMAITDVNREEIKADYEEITARLEANETSDES